MSLSKPTMSAIRFGYGLAPGQVPPADGKALLADVRAGLEQKTLFPTEGIEGRYDTLVDIQDRTSALKGQDKETRRKNLRPIRKDVFRISAADLHARVAQAVFSPNPFYERLAAFWTDHFSVSVKKQRMMNLMVPLYEAEAIRPFIGSRFSQLLRAAITHPAMLVYLDQNKSFGPNSRRGEKNGKGLNENLGRELLELHTLGVDGGYDQKDVRAAALILTGMAVDRKEWQFEFRRQIAEPGPIELFGKSYGGRRRSMDEIHELLDDLAARPETARHIARKLAIHFIADEPDQDLVDTMAEAYRRTDGDLMAVYAALLDHPAAWADPGRKARQPFDYVVAGLRAVNPPVTAFEMPSRNADGDDPDSEVMRPKAGKKRQMAMPMTATAADSADRQEQDEEMESMKRKDKLRPALNPLTVGALRRMGQPLWEPDSPAGTEEDFDAWISASQLTTRIDWAHRLAARLASQKDPPAFLKAVLADAARDDTIRVVSQAPNRKAGIALVLSSPEFNRR